MDKIYIELAFSGKLFELVIFKSRYLNNISIHLVIWLEWIFPTPLNNILKKETLDSVIRFLLIHVLDKFGIANHFLLDVDLTI